MRTRHLLLLGLLLATVAVTFTGCDIFGTSIEKRLEYFIAALNSSDRSGVTVNFADPETVNYASADAAYWNVRFPVPASSSENYVLSSINASDPSNVTASMTGPAAWSLSARPAYFKMIQKGFMDYHIQEFYLDNLSSPVLKNLAR
jgi:hypothetical protein